MRVNWRAGLEGARYAVLAVGIAVASALLALVAAIIATTLFGTNALVLAAFAACVVILVGFIAGLVSA